MAKLLFRYGAMNSGKTTILIQTAHNYEERDQRVIVIKPSEDTKGASKIVSRLGVDREVDYLVNKDTNIIDLLENKFDNLDCILVDEAQFITKEQAFQLMIIAKVYDVHVIAYGLRTDFKTNGFEGATRLLELADELQEMPTICRCGKKARFNGRKVNGEFVIEGESVAIDNSPDYQYESLCGKCYLEKVLNTRKSKKIK